MRGDTDSPARRRTRLTNPALRSLVAALVLLAAVAWSRSAASPIVLLLAASLVLAIRFVDSPAVLALPVIAAVVIVFTDAIGAAFSAGTVVTAVLLMAATWPGLVWRREERRTTARLLQLDDIVARAAIDHATREAAAAAAAELADLERALASVAARIQARAVILWDVDAYHGTARARAGSHGRPATVLRLTGDPIGWAWEQGMRLRLEHPPRWAEQDAVIVAERLRRHEDFGLIVTYVFDPTRLPADDMPFEETAVYLRGVIALHDARAVAANSERRVSTLLARLQKIPDELDPDAYIAGLCDTAMAMTDATGAAIGVWDGEEGRVIAVSGDDGGPRIGDSFRAPESELGLAMRAGTMLERDAGSWSLGRTSIANGDERWLTRPRALAALPLRGPTGTHGVLAVWSSGTRAFDPEALRLLYLLSPHSALHLEQARAFERMRESAARDPLTQLRNRRAFDELFATETTRFERYGRPLALLMLDLDHFKNVNDQFGHEAGDDVLRRVARVFPTCSRDIDTAARFGGEEFVVLMPETSLAAALDVAERIRAAVAALDIDWRGTRIPVTISIGVSVAPERVPHPDGLIGSADAALYQAKAAGRNRVTAA
ncbi:MAG TPA: GGDEF domain-containing protein [Longimicrobiales bacterium]|nr:GGDEF domain-containing protein [Longimicrobiales bacterium]